MVYSWWSYIRRAVKLQARITIFLFIFCSHCFDLVNIYMYYAPAFFVLLFRHYCLSPQFSIAKLFYLGVAVAVVFALSFGPFIYFGQVMSLIIH